jgi:hypothetical protein
MREIDLGFRGYTPILSETAQEYAINCCNDVVANFEKRTVDYFFVRFNDENDAWFLADSNVQARKSLAKYAFRKAAGLPVLEPQTPERQTPAATKRRVEQCAQSVNLGPMPINEAALSANPHLYMPWLYTALQRLEARPPSIQEPIAQNFASKGYIHRMLKEASIPAITYSDLLF